MANIIQSFPSGGAGGGHTILDSTGTEVAQESKLQFNGLSVTDDSTNGITEVEAEGLNQDSIDDIAGASTLTPAVIIGDANVYSTNEKIIGKWVDGKPLYQKTYNFGALPNTTNKYVNTNLNLSTTTVRNIFGLATYDDGNSLQYCPLPFISSSASWHISLQLCKNNNDLSILISTSANWSNASAYVTIQYTKTTD